MSNILNTQFSNDSVLSYCADLKGITEQLILSNDIYKLDTIKAAIHKIHTLRSKYPQHEKEINAMLFEMIKKSCTVTDEAVRQGTMVAFLTGFERNPVSDSQEAKNLIFAMSNVPNLQYTLPMIQRITLNLSKTYAEKLKSTDSDLSLAHMLKDFTEYCYWKKQKKTATDNNWAHAITHTLAGVYPTPDFQKAADTFQYKPSHYTGNKVNLPEEFSTVYTYKSPLQGNHFSEEYEKE